MTHYAQGRCDSFPETAPAALVVSQFDRLRPDIVLLSSDQRGSPADALSNHVTAQGFKTVERANLPGGCEQLQVLVRRTGGNDVAIEGGARLMTLTDGARTRADEPRSCPSVPVHEARCAPPAALKGDKPRS